MIEIAEGVWVQPEHVTMVKAADDKCVVWVTGQSALDGFVIDRDAEDVVEEIDAALEDEDGRQVDAEGA